MLLAGRTCIANVCNPTPHQPAALYEALRDKWTPTGQMQSTEGSRRSFLSRNSFYKQQQIISKRTDPPLTLLHTISEAPIRDDSSQEHDRHQPHRPCPSQPLSIFVSSNFGRTDCRPCRKTAPKFVCAGDVWSICTSVRTHRSIQTRSNSLQIPKRLAFNFHFVSNLSFPSYDHHGL